MSKYSDARRIAAEINQDAERYALRARLADTERQLREAQERCERLGWVGLNILIRWRKEACDSFGTPDMPLEKAWPIEDPKGYALWKELRAALTPEPDEMTEAMKEGKL